MYLEYSYYLINTIRKFFGSRSIEPDILFGSARFGQRWIKAVAVCLVCIAASDSGVAAQGVEGGTPQPAVREQRFDAWTVRCIEPASTPAVSTKDARCEATQSVVVEQDGREVEVLKLAVTATDDKAGKAEWALVALFPLDVLLNADFGLSVGKGKPRLYRFRNCSHLGCFGLAPIDRNLLGGFNDAPEAAMFFRLLNGQAVKLVFSLKGFRQAVSALKSGPASLSPSPAAKGRAKP